MNDVQARRAGSRSARAPAALIAADGARDAIARILDDHGLETTVFDCVEEVLDNDACDTPSVAVLCVQDNFPSSLSQLVQPLAQRFEQSPIVVVCAEIKRWGIRSALSAGAAGVVLYDELDAALGACLQAVLAGQVCVPRQHSRQIEPRRALRAREADPRLGRDGLHEQPNRRAALRRREHREESSLLGVRQTGSAVAKRGGRPHSRLPSAAWAWEFFPGGEPVETTDCGGHNRPRDWATAWGNRGERRHEQRDRVSDRVAQSGGSSPRGLETDLETTRTADAQSTRNRRATARGSTSGATSSFAARCSSPMWGLHRSPRRAFADHGQAVASHLGERRRSACTGRGGEDLRPLRP